MSEEGLAVPSVGDRYVKRDEPDRGRVVTVNRVWTADDGHTAVAYGWRDNRPGQMGSACPLDVFHRTYRPEAEESARQRLLDVLNGNYMPLEPPESLIDAYAHELAEKVRLDRDATIPIHSAERKGMTRSADLIDPEVSS